MELECVNALVSVVKQSLVLTWSTDGADSSITVSQYNFLIVGTSSY